MMSAVLSIIFLFLPGIPYAYPQAFNVSKSVVFPGDVITIYAPRGNLKVFFLGNVFDFSPTERNGYISLVAVPLTVKAGKYDLKISSAYFCEITVRKKQFPERMMDFKPLSAGELARYRREEIELKRILSSSSKALPLTLPFAKPLKQLAITSEFGTIRKTKYGIGRHWGVDFLAENNEEITVIGRGKAVMAKETLLGGNTIVIDHGSGLFSVYMHLSKINVKENDILSANAVIGHAGASGRATGINLHFGIYIKGIAVNPTEVFKITKPA
jgi:murein DD-endopeptidase MepM/ murein hydrolase activator NlpD